MSSWRDLGKDSLKWVTSLEVKWRTKNEWRVGLKIIKVWAALRKYEGSTDRVTGSNNIVNPVDKEIGRRTCGNKKEKWGS